MDIIFIGSGNVATHLAPALKSVGHQIVQIYSRTLKNASELAELVSAEAIDNLKNLKTADLYIYSVADNALAEVIKEVEVYTGIHAHTTGSIGIEVFGNKFENFGVLYPLQTFSKQKRVDFNQIPVFVEANNVSTNDTLLNIAQSISQKCMLASSEHRIKLHIAAVFACNFTNYFYSIANELLEKENIPFEYLKPLIIETALKIEKLNPAEAQTGPARRNDFETLQKHVAMLGESDLAEIYSLISQKISSKYNS